VQNARRAVTPRLVAATPRLVAVTPRLVAASSVVEARLGDAAAVAAELCPVPGHHASRDSKGGQQPELLGELPTGRGQGA
jgi:hypothetical protein